MSTFRSAIDIFIPPSLVMAGLRGMLTGGAGFSGPHSFERTHRRGRPDGIRYGQQKQL